MNASLLPWPMILWVERESVITGTQRVCLWNSCSRADQTCFSASPPKQRRCETPKYIKKKRRGWRRQKSHQRGLKLDESECWLITVLDRGCNSNRETFLTSLSVFCCLEISSSLCILEESRLDLAQRRHGWIFDFKDIMHRLVTLIPQICICFFSIKWK